MCQGPKLLVLIAVAGVLLALGLPPILRLFETDEARVRAVLVRTEAGFASSDLSDCLGGFAEDYREGTHGWSRGQLERGLQFLFFSWSQGETRWRLEVDHDLVEVDGPDGDEGEWKMVFDLGVDAGRDEPWRLRVTACLREIEGDFQFVRSEYREIGGRRPF